MIFSFIPYALDKKNYGHACNQCMELIGEDDWAILINYDVMFTTDYWLQQCYDAIDKNPEIGLFTCYTNRMGNPVQKLDNAPGGHDIQKHREFGEKMRKEYGTNVRRWDDTKHKMGGMFMLINKKAWQEAGKFKNGFEFVDHNMFDKFPTPIGIIEGLYVYHWRRG